MRTVRDVDSTPDGDNQSNEMNRSSVHGRMALMEDAEVIDLTQWSVLFPGGGEDIYGSVYSGTFSVLDGSQVEDVTRDRIAHVEAYDVLDGDCAETDIAALAELTDGSWATVMAYCDTTGWDCQADAQWKWAPTRELAISQGLDREARRRLNVSLPNDAT